MSRIVKFEVEVEVLDDKATHVAVDKLGAYSYRSKPKMLFENQEWDGVSCADCVVKNWKDLCAELPKVETDWSTVKPLTRVFYKGCVCEFLNYYDIIGEIRLLFNHREVCTSAKNVELVEENGGVE